MKRRFSIVRPTAKDAIAMWHRQYGFASRLLADGSNSGEISKKLRALKRPTKDQVNALVGGGDGWTSVWCTSCGEYAPEAVSFESGDYSSEICLGCLEAALKKLRPRR